MELPPRRARPRPPWRDLPCTAQTLVAITGAIARNDERALHDWLTSADCVDHVIDVLCARHRLGPWLHARLRASAWWPMCPVVAQNRITDAVVQQRAVTLQWNAQVAAVTSVLAQHHIAYAILKGGELGTRTLGDAAGRAYRDLDILIAPECFSTLARALSARGYTQLSRFPLGTTVTAWFHHAADFARKADLLDVHWSISRLPGVHSDTTSILRRALAMRIEAVDTHVLADHDELTLLLLSSLADIQRGAFRLQSVVDVLALVARIKSDEWSAFFASRETDGSATACRGMLHLAFSLFGMRIPAALQQYLQPPTAVEHALAIVSGRQTMRRRWVRNQLNISVWRYAAWWTVSLPFRVAASHPSFRRTARAT